ncbi:hypothetical protein F2Q70_00043759 [Brassica cretica]|uniref:Uncharacterized protein n=1 Tax=Brassica cretica TaxID=69181 RepID=A0A8S9KQ51_BRACR|nr:hypothetical protein F2Q70_00043759 [Brassica cretica]
MIKTRISSVGTYCQETRHTHHWIRGRIHHKWGKLVTPPSRDLDIRPRRFDRNETALVQIRGIDREQECVGLGQLGQVRTVVGPYGRPKVATGRWALLVGPWAWEISLGLGLTCLDVSGRSSIYLETSKIQQVESRPLIVIDGQDLSRKDAWKGCVPLHMAFAGETEDELEPAEVRVDELSELSDTNLELDELSDTTFELSELSDTEDRADLAAGRNGPCSAQGKNTSCFLVRLSPSKHSLFRWTCASYQATFRNPYFVGLVCHIKQQLKSGSIKRLSAPLVSPFNTSVLPFGEFISL